MKAQPLINWSSGLVECTPEEATHLKIKIPGPTGILILPIVTSGPREGTPCWTWNGDSDKPTLRPSLLSTIKYVEPSVICHCFVNDGFVHFLPDSTHSLAGQTVALLQLEESDL